MLTPSELERIPQAFASAFTNAEMRIMTDIIRRIKDTGEITRAADYQIYRLINLGEQRKTLDEIIKRTLDITTTELTKLYTDVLEKDYARDMDIYKATGKEFIPYKKNVPLQQVIEAVKNQTNGDFKNITQSLGFARKVNGKIVFSPLAETYQRILNDAVTDLTMGGFDYNTILKRTISELVNSGLRTVDYSTGYSNRVSAAARTAVLTGLSQVTAKINEINAEKLETNHFEVSWHATARPDHQIWQGRVYSSEELISVCGLGDVTGLTGANCRHSYRAFVLGASVRMYTDEELEELNKKENTPTEYQGVLYTSYQATQYQRKLERMIGRKIQEIKLLETGGASEDDLINANAKLRSLSTKYADFSKAMGLPQQRQRIYMDGLGRV